MVVCEENISPSSDFNENATVQSGDETLTNQLQEYYINFAEAGYIGELHLILKESLEFPDWYGETLDALWDMLTNYLEPCVVYKQLTYTINDRIKTKKKE